jgi:two-component system alkaline phosphatase synthesis response regulator PhoP
MTIAITPDKKSKMPHVNETQAINSILLVDDQPDFLENLGLVLETANYRVLTARDGLRALSILKTQPVSLILSDIEMPSMNGYQLYHAVRTNPEWVTIPFLFLSGRDLDSDIRHGKELGVDDYLLKPIRPRDLISIIQGKLRRIQKLTQTNRAKSAASIQTSTPLTI